MRSQSSTAVHSTKTRGKARVSGKASGNPGGQGKPVVSETKKPDAESGKKQLPLRISGKLYKELAAWAEDDFRSINGQIEYLLTECVKKRRGI